MPYRIDDDSLFDDSNKDPAPWFEFRLFHIVIIVMVIVLILLIFYVIPSIDWDAVDSDEVDKLDIVGSLEPFTKPINGDIILESSRFYLETAQGQFDEEDKDIVIKGFDGDLLYDNSTLELKGTASNVSFGSNILFLENSPFTLEFKGKTSFNLLVDSFDFTIKDATIKFGDDLIYDVSNASLTIDSFNGTFAYDSIFSLSSPVNAFNLETQEGVSIDYLSKN